MPLVGWINAEVESVGVNTLLMQLGWILFTPNGLGLFLQHPIY